MSRRTATFLLGGLIAALVLAVGVSQFASSQPDGLERVAAEEGIDADVLDHSLADSPFADYGTSGVSNERVGTGIAGFLGVLVTFGVTAALVALAVVVFRRRPNVADPPGSTLETS